MAQTTRRKSAFQEIGLSSSENNLAPPAPIRSRPQSVRFRSKDEIHVVDRFEDDMMRGEDEHKDSHPDARLPHALPPRVSQSPIPDFTRSIMYRIGVCVLLIAAAIPLLPRSSIGGHASIIPIQGVQGGPVPNKPASRKVFDLEKRVDTDTYACFRWAQQCMRQAMRCYDERN